MKGHDALVLFLFGLLFWMLGTLWFEVRGVVVFETTSLRYWINFILTPVASAAMCVTIFRWRAIPAGGWAAAALLIALPGMAGEALVLSRFAAMMPRMQPSSAGRYGSFLFATYALVLGLAEVVTLRAEQ